MKREIFPIEIVENSTEKLFEKNSIKTLFIYNFVLFAAVSALVSIFFIHLDVNVATSGMLKTPGERFVITAPYSAFIDDFYVVENLTVERGDPIFVLNSNQFNSETEKNRARLQEIAVFIRDLDQLIKIGNGSSQARVDLRSVVYKYSYNYYLSQREDLTNRIDGLRGNYERSERLNRFGDISAADFESISSEYNNAVQAVKLLHDRQVSEWQLERENYFNEQRDLNFQIEQLDIKRLESAVTSPVSGVVHKIEGVTKYSHVQQGQKIMEISMDSTIYAECMVSPHDIGFIHEGQPVRIQIDAYNYNEWGFVEGEVLEIFKDVSLVSSASGEMPFFRVICSLDRTHMELKNGHKGRLGRGMTITARFKIARRTIAQLLYDKVDDWINPNNISNN